jgi:hypothetical protein
MAASGYTPISLYYSATATNVPLAGNLVAGELAINTADGKLYYKDNANVVRVIASKDVTGTVTSVGGTGTVNGITLTGTVTSSGNLTLGGTLSGVNLASQVTGTLPVANGGTGATSLTGVVIGNGTSAFTVKTNPSGDFVGTTDTQTLTNKTVTNLVFDGDFTEEVFTISDGGSVDLDPSNGTIQLWTLGASRSPTANSFAAGQSMTLMIDDGSDFAITWPSVTWRNNAGTAPTLATSGYTVVVLWKVSTTLYGALVGNGT